MYDFKKVESEVLDFWHKNNIFEKSLEARKKAPPSSRLRRAGKRFVFWEGPPTANGKPGIHHFLGRAFKDLFCRYKTMQGFFVLRKAGWDTHGLPVEIEVEKELGFKNKKDIENYGIDKFNKKAKESVWKYKTEWEEMTKKMGFWLDLKNPYITYDNKYVESLWAIIKKIWDQDLLYLAHKVVPFCTRCGTSLSSHEVAQGYKRITDKSVMLKFKVTTGKRSEPRQQPSEAEQWSHGRRRMTENTKAHNLKPNTYILAWTTTPWTLPGNVALAVGPEIQYIVAKKYSETFILAKELAEKVLGSGYEIEKELLGKDLVGVEYAPLFDIEKLKSKTSYKIYDADFVSTVEGTGVVHMAPMYGEDDYKIGTKFNLPRFHTVNETGKFVGVGEDLDGLYVKSKETEEKIIAYLDKKNFLLKTEDYEHDYPFCWRCDSPLLYYAKDSWFIKMSAVNDRLLKNNQKVNWIPEHIKDGRFGQWLKEGKDWAFSRERYWGTPLPVWECVKCRSHKVAGSIKEIKTRAISKGNKYYLVRHGLTTRDELGKMIIGSDPEKDNHTLTAQGRKMVEATAHKIKSLGGADFIFTSPFMRTKETGEIIGKLLHVNAHEDERLKEIIHGGGCDGKPHAECPVGGDKRKSFDGKPHPNSESQNDTRIRVHDFIKDIDSKYSGKTIVIVSHGDPLWLLYNVGLGLKEEEIPKEKDGWYPYFAEMRELKWETIPRNELGELDLHRPFIDSIAFKCSECGAMMKKVPDLIDVWFDSGAMPYAQWHWPFDTSQGKPFKKMFKEQFPADFISEGVDQTRGWFYTLIAISTLLGKGNPYKNVMSLSHVLDEKGKKMSKSKGNVVSPFEVMDKVGADAARWYFYTVNSPGEYKTFSYKDVEAKLKGFIFTVQNCLRFYELYESNIHDSKPKAPKLSDLDNWILSKLNGLFAEVTEKLDAYDPMTAARAIEKFVMDDLSNWWLRRSRKRKEALGLLRLLLLEVAKILAPFTPFMAEDIHRRLSSNFQFPNKESVHLYDWPVPNKKLINKKLELEMEEVKNIVTLGLAIRKDNQIKVRQPLQSAKIKRATKFSNDLENLVKDELNVKEIEYTKAGEVVVELDKKLNEALIKEGYARELIRQIQDMRKEAKYRLDDVIHGQWHSGDSEVSSAINKWQEEIKKDVLLKDFVNGPHDDKAYDVEKEFELAPQKKIWAGVKK